MDSHLFRAATEVPGTFRVKGLSRRVRDLQAQFERPPLVCTIPQDPYLDFSL